MKAHKATKTLKRANLTEEIALSIPSEFKFIYLLDLVISYVAKEMKFDEETKEQVNLAVIEAGTNAIRHGSGGNPENPTQIRFCIAKDKLTVFVKDNGPGFDPDSVGDPLSPENVLKPSGRGIFLMKALMDEVAYSIEKGSGTEVKLVKYKNSKRV